VINEFVLNDGVTALIATSNMSEAERGHRVALFHQGLVLACDTPDNLKESGGAAFYNLKAGDQEAAANALRSGETCSEVIPSGNRLILRSVEDAKARIEAELSTSGVEIILLERTEPTMEYVFRQAIQRTGVEADTTPVHVLLDRYDFNSAAPADSASVVQADRLLKRFGSFTAVDHVSLEVRRGEVFGFLGPNGAGKTTLIKMLCGLMKPTGGEGTILGIPLAGDGRRIADRIGYMSQKFSLYNDLRAIENIELFGGIYGLDRSELGKMAELAIDLSNLRGRERQKTKSLPLGMKQRLALACAILHNPELIFLDEPTSGVDPLARDRFWNIIFELSRRMGKTVIVTTHYMEEAERCDRLILMDDGVIRATGTPGELRRGVEAEIGKPLGITCAEPGRAYEILRDAFESVSYYGATTLVYSRESRRDEVRIASLLTEAGVGVHTIREHEVPFDDVFIHYVEKEEPESEQTAQSA